MNAASSRIARVDRQARPAAAAEVGAVGSDRIRWIQRALNRIVGAGIAEDGRMGPQTRGAIRRFQAQQGLVADGVVGPLTEQAMRRAGAVSPPARPGPTAAVPATTCHTLDGFDFDSDRVRPQHQAMIVGIARSILGMGSARPVVSVVGHTDPEGDAAYNVDLGRRRAEQVTDSLRRTLDRIRPGSASGTVFDVQSRGESQPRSTDPARNRRVEVCLRRAPAPPDRRVPTDEIDAIRREHDDLIRRLRDPNNVDNLRRTLFYGLYYQQHPEVPWSLLAHLVSRNAGYQMSDMMRYAEYARLASVGSDVANFVGFAVPLQQLASQFGVSVEVLGDLVELVRRFIEAGNYLIFHDVVPQLLLYIALKRRHLEGRPAPDEAFRLLAAHGVDPSMIQQWRQFFPAARQNAFWAGRASEADPHVVRHSHALIINEQNFLEDRLVNPIPGTPRYVAGPLVQAMRMAMDRLDARLVFVGSTSPTSPTTVSSILLHSVAHFLDLGRRIDTGRMLYFGVFLRATERFAAIRRWALAKPHDGSRLAYDEFHYTTEGVENLLRGRFTSRPVPQGLLPNWPGPPPPTLPSWSSRRGGLTSRFAPMLAELRADPFSPPRGETLPPTAARPLREIIV